MPTLQISMNVNPIMEDVNITVSILSEVITVPVILASL